MWVLRVSLCFSFEFSFQIAFKNYENSLEFNVQQKSLLIFQLWKYAKSFSLELLSFSTLSLFWNVTIYCVSCEKHEIKLHPYYLSWYFYCVCLYPHVNWISGCLAMATQQWTKLHRPSPVQYSIFNPIGVPICNKSSNNSTIQIDRHFIKPSREVVCRRFEELWEGPI